MGRPKNPIRPTGFHTTVPEDLKAALDAALWCPARGQIPRGSYSTFLAKAIEDFLTKRRKQNGRL
jgi:hypothetical protein